VYRRPRVWRSATTTRSALRRRARWRNPARRYLDDDGFDRATAGASQVCWHLVCCPDKLCRSREQGHDAPLIATLSASSWTLTPPPAEQPATGVLTGVSCTAPTSCVAVGTSGTIGFVDVLSAGGWSEAVPPLPTGTLRDRLVAVSCAAATSCVAVGYENGGPHVTGPLVETLRAVLGRLPPFLCSNAPAPPPTPSRARLSRTASSPAMTPRGR